MTHPLIRLFVSISSSTPEPPQSFRRPTQQLSGGGPLGNELAESQSRRPLK